MLGTDSYPKALSGNNPAKAMKKYDIFTRSHRGARWRAAGYVLAPSPFDAGALAASKYSGLWVKALPAIITI